MFYLFILGTGLVIAVFVGSFDEIAEVVAALLKGIFSDLLEKALAPAKLPLTLWDVGKGKVKPF